MLGSCTVALKGMVSGNVNCALSVGEVRAIEAVVLVGVVLVLVTNRVTAVEVVVWLLELVARALS